MKKKTESEVLILNYNQQTKSKYYLMYTECFYAKSLETFFFPWIIQKSRYIKTWFHLCIYYLSEGLTECIHANIYEENKMLYISKFFFYYTYAYLHLYSYRKSYALYIYLHAYTHYIYYFNTFVFLHLFTCIH